MVLGAFGPWVKALGQGVGGTDGSNDGWLVVVAAGLGGLLSYTLRGRRAAGVWAFLGGIAGAAITLYDRSNVQDAIDRSGALAQTLVQIGWGLNLALLASVSMTIAGAVYAWTQRPEETPLSKPATGPPRTADSPPLAEPPIFAWTQRTEEQPPPVSPDGLAPGPTPPPD
jgi:hypothetical protein